MNKSIKLRLIIMNILQWAVWERTLLQWAATLPL